MLVAIHETELLICWFISVMMGSQINHDHATGYLADFDCSKADGFVPAVYVGF